MDIMRGVLNSISKHNNDYNNNLYSSPVNNKGISPVGKRSLIDARVFDVFSTKDISKDVPFLDVFTKKFLPTEIN